MSSTSASCARSSGDSNRAAADPHPPLAAPSPPVQSPVPLHLFQAFGVELEYMIVERDSLRVAPIADRLLSAAAESPGARADFEDGSNVPTEVALGPVSWSNELVAHVVEFKTTAPAPSLADLPRLFQESVSLANHLLAPHGAVLLPGAMHPTMNPAREMVLWPHGNGEIYATFNRIFDCRGHGWSNLQAAHLNLPFADDEEFGRLHAAVRALLPVMPALAASSPIMDGSVTGTLDNRMEVYRTNARRVPSVAGMVVPEPVFTEQDYRETIFDRIRRDLALLDTDGVLRDEWCNSRGCIARFSRGSVEIRVLDVQECPAADLAIAALIVAVLRELAGGPQDSLRALDTERLSRTLLATTRDADHAVIDDADYLRALGGPPGPCSAMALWRHLWMRALGSSSELTTHLRPLQTIMARGPLARRILSATGPRPDAASVRSVYAELARCLAEGRMFRPEGG